MFRKKIRPENRVKSIHGLDFMWTCREGQRGKGRMELRVSVLAAGKGFARTREKQRTREKERTCCQQKTAGSLETEEVGLWPCLKAWKEFEQVEIVHLVTQRNAKDRRSQKEYNQKNPYLYCTLSSFFLNVELSLVKSTLGHSSDDKEEEISSYRSFFFFFNTFRTQF